MKNVIDKIPRVEIQERENNFGRLYENLSQTIDLVIESENLPEDEKAKSNRKLLDEKKVIKMLQNKEQRSATEKLVKNKDFSEKDMSRLVSKGLSTHEKEDMEELKSLMKKFQPAIMAIGSDIKEVEQKIDEKVKEMKPSPELNSPSTSPAKESEEGIIP